MPNARIRELDGLRALAVLAVMSFHYTIGGPLANRVTRMGWVGVDLFFVLSGYLITGILLESCRRARYFRTFYARRTLRIFPIYYLLLAVYVLSARIAGGPQPWLYWAMHAAYLSSIVEHFHYWHIRAPLFVFAGVTVLWSLSIEEQFYLLWAPVVRLVSTRRLWRGLGARVLAAPVLRWIIHNPGGSEYRFLPARFDDLAWGAGLALLEFRRGRWAAKRWLGVALGAGAAVAVLVATTGGARASHWFSTLGYSAIGILFASLLGWTLARSGTNAAACRLLRSAPLQTLGRVSYAFYLIHYPVFMLVGSRLGWLGAGPLEAAVRAAISLGLSLLLAMLSWRYLEGPILRFKDRWAPALGQAGHARAKKAEPPPAAVRMRG